MKANLASFGQCNEPFASESDMSVMISLTILALLAITAWHDLATRTIPDTIGALVLTAGILGRVVEGPAALSLSVVTASVLFVLLVIIHSRAMIGGGDVKIMTALAVGLSPLDSYRFVIATAIAGGVLGVVYLVLSRCLKDQEKNRRTSLLGRVAAVETWRIRRRGPLPYGVAIAAGGAFVLLYPGSF